MGRLCLDDIRSGLQVIITGLLASRNVDLFSVRRNESAVVAQTHVHGQVSSRLPLVAEVYTHHSAPAGFLKCIALSGGIRNVQQVGSERASNVPQILRVPSLRGRECAGGIVKDAD